MAQLKKLLSSADVFITNIRAGIRIPPSQPPPYVCEFHTVSKSPAWLLIPKVIDP